MSLTPYEAQKTFVKWAECLPKPVLLNLLEESFSLGQLNGSKLWAGFYMQLEDSLKQIQQDKEPGNEFEAFLFVNDF